MPQPFSGGRPRVVIVGAGFGGLAAARKLAGRPVDVLIVDRNNYHCFQPLLYQVATAGLEPDQIAHPVRAIIRRDANVRFMMTHVEAVDAAGRVLRTPDGDLPYDILILAAGSATNFFGMDSVAARAFQLKDINHAVDLRNHILTLFEKASSETDPARRTAMLTFCVVGGGPTGVEFAGALSELIRLVLVKDFPGLNLSDITIHLLEAGDTLLAGFPEPLRNAALEVLADKKVQVTLNCRVTGMDDGLVYRADGPDIPSLTLLWAAGVRGASIGETLGVTLARQARIPVDATLRLPAHPNIYVIGDLAHREENGAALPMVAQVAMQQGECAARNILRGLNGEPPVDFVYRDPGSLATIGRNQAVARIGRFRFTGFPAWFVWLVVHLIGLIGFRNRLIVLINWAWDYFFYDRGVRLITRREE